MKGESGFFSDLGMFSSAREDFLEELNGALESTRERLRVDTCFLLMLDETRKTLMLWPSFSVAEAVPGMLRVPKDEGVFWKAVKEMRTVASSEMAEILHHPFTSELGDGRSVSMLCAPVMDSGVCIGALCVHREGQSEFTSEDFAELERTAASLSAPLKTAWFYENVRNKVKILSDLNEMSGLLNVTNDLEVILARVVEYSARITGASRQLVWLLGRDGDVSPSVFPSAWGDDEYLRPVREGIVSDAVRAKKAVIVDDVKQYSGDDGLSRVAEKSAIAQPMIIDHNVVGVMLLADRVSGLPEEYSAFSGEEVKNLESIARMAAQAITRARMMERLQAALEENRKNVDELSILFQLSMALQRTISLDDLLRVILSCVTVGRGLGFNRAVLFLVNENTGLIQGMMGLGPDSASDAGRIWSDLNKQADKSADFISWLLERDPYEIGDSLFNRHALSIRASVKGKSVLATVVKDKKAINIRGRGDIGEEDEDLVSILECDHFAVVPMIVRDTVVGAILVDNKYNQVPIEDSDIELLTRFAAPAAWAVENIKLVERLAAVNKELITLENQMARAEKLAALGEISAEMAHELKNPLVTIGGFARRMLAKVSGAKPEAKYASIIVKEVERLESLLRDTLDVTKGLVIDRKSVDFNQIIREVVEFYRGSIEEKGIGLTISLAPDVGEASIDPSQIKQVFINLLVNAIDSMACPRHDYPKNLTIKSEPVPGDRRHVRLIISDTGGGIAERDLPDIFNPFFTTKASGTGLGLSLCKKIVRLHHGTMEIDNRLGVGVTFTITLPSEAVKED